MAVELGEVGVAGMLIVMDAIGQIQFGDAFLLGWAKESAPLAINRSDELGHLIQFISSLRSLPIGESDRESFWLGSAIVWIDRLERLGQNHDVKNLTFPEVVSAGQTGSPLIPSVI
jgi:hypothetical protein